MVFGYFYLVHNKFTNFVAIFLLKYFPEFKIYGII